MDAEPTLEVARALGPSILWSSLKVGGLAGVVGMGFGGAAGLIRSTTPTLFALASGVQCFTLGSTFWMTRQSMLVYQARQRGTDVYNLSARQRLEASIFAGGCSGATVAALFRGRTNVIPGAIMFSLYGFLGQGLYNMLDKQHAEEIANPSMGIWERLLNSRLNPMTKLTDEEYEIMLKRKLLRVEAEIALLDDNIKKVRNEETKNTESPPR